MCMQNLVKFCPLVLKILSGNEILTSIKGHYLVKFCPFVLKILSGNENDDENDDGITERQNDRKTE